MKDYESLLIGVLAGLSVFLVIVIRMRRRRSHATDKAVKNG